MAAIHASLRLIAIATLALVVTCGDSGFASAAPLVSVGAPLPAFAVDSLDGGKLTSAAFRGKPMFLNFFASWCRPCKMEIPHIEERYQSYSQRVVFLGIDEAESPDVVGPFAKQMGISYSVGIDQGDVAVAFDVRTIPESVFVDRAGVVRAINVGNLTPAALDHSLALITAR